MPDGARFGALMAALADHRRRPVLIAPRAAVLDVVELYGPDQRPDPLGLDIAPRLLTGRRIPWQVIWPGESWEHRSGREIVSSETAFGEDAFMLGLHAGRDGLLLLYSGRGGIATGRPGRSHLQALGWRPGQGIVVVTERWPGPEAAASTARVLARRSGSPVLAADTYAWAAPDGRALAAPGRGGRRGPACARWHAGQLGAGAA